jgi:hypothetical protein
MAIEKDQNKVSEAGAAAAAEKAAAEVAAAAKVAVEVDAAAPKVETVELVELRSVYGLMIHPYTEAHFNIGPVTKHVIYGWVKGQMEAGKIVLA